MLVSIVEIAERCGLPLKKTTKPDQYVTHCPFCGDDEKHWHMSIHAGKDTYRCVKCDAHGGATALYASLRNLSWEEAKAELYPKSNTPQRKRKRHPAESLSPEQLKLIGFQRKPYRMRKPTGMDEIAWRRYQRQTFDWIWSEWLRYQRFQRKIEKLLLDAERRHEKEEKTC